MALRTLEENLTLKEIQLLRTVIRFHNAISDKMSFNRKTIVTEAVLLNVCYLGATGEGNKM